MDKLMMQGRYAELLDIEFENKGLTPEEQAEFDTLDAAIGALPTETTE